MQRTNELPTVFLDVIQVNSIAGEGIAVASSVDASAPEFLSFLISEVPMIPLVENAIGKSTARANGEQVPFQTCAV